MLAEKKLNFRHAQAGLSLIELMISIVLGLLLLGAATAMTVSSMVMNADTLKSARLNQDLDSVLQIMVNDIRRAGYSATFDPDPALIDVDFDDNEDLNIVTSDCILYAYNADGNSGSDLEPEEKYGFKLVGSTIQMRTTCTTGACSTSCSAGTWVPLTDDSVINITNLSFDSLNSKCMNIRDPSSGINNSYWVTVADATTEFPCLAAVDDIGRAELENYVADASGDFPLPGFGVIGTVSVPNAEDTLIELRQVNLVIEAELENDPSVIKRQVVAINIRNNRVITPVASP